MSLLDVKVILLQMMLPKWVTTAIVTVIFLIKRELSYNIDLFLFLVNRSTKYFSYLYDVLTTDMIRDYTLYEATLYVCLTSIEYIVRIAFFDSALDSVDNKSLYPKCNSIYPLEAIAS